MNSKPSPFTGLRRRGKPLISDSKTDKSNWFKKAGFTNTLKIPTTPGKKLASLIMETLKKCQALGGTNKKSGGERRKE